MPVLAALAAACGLAAATARASDHTAPTAQTLAPTPVAGVVVLHGTVDAGHQKTTYWFEVGPTTAYGSTTQPATVDKKDPVAVMSVVSGLLKGGSYHARLVARNDDGLSLGADVPFTGAGLIPAVSVPAPLPGSAPAGGPSDPASDSDPGASAPVLPAPSPPALGQTLGVAAQAGAVLVRLPGSARAVALTDAASIPVGTTLDTRKGTVTLSAALPGERTQTGTFHGGLFEVRQPVGAHGMTELVLRGALPTCPRGGARAAAVTRRRPPRSLWGHDSHGHFRTRASNSVITVRGTTWFVSDRCEGTLTRVTSGSVAVRDVRTGRTVVVRAGQRHLARRAG